MGKPRRVSLKHTKLTGLYTSVPIDQSTRSTRLLSFHRDRETNLHGTLRVYNLNHERTPWVALSYTWDSYDLVDTEMRQREDDGNYCIKLNGEDMPIRENLWRALQAILDQREFHAAAAERAEHTSEPFDEGVGVGGSLADDEQLFWIDAVCIDQSSVKKRSHQVGMMNSIYSRAALVMGWLGPCWQQIEPWQASHLTTCLDSCMQSNETRIQRNCSCEKPCLRDFEPKPSVQTPPSDKVVLHMSPAEEHRAEAMRHKIAVFKSAYWRRMWILQEVILPKRIMFLYGSVLLSPDFLYNKNPLDDVNAMRSVLAHRKQYNHVLSPLSAVITSHRWVPAIRHDHTQPFCNHTYPYLTLTDLIRLYGHHGCSDHRDRAYALLSLLPENYPLKADYELSRRDLLKAIVRYETIDPTDLRIMRRWADALSLTDYLDQDLTDVFHASQSSERLVHKRIGITATIKRYIDWSKL